MDKTGLIFDEKLIKEFYKDSGDLVLIIDHEKNIIYLNKKSIDLLGKPESSSQIEHLFSFDVCALNKEIILNYNPLNQAIWAKENIKSEILFQKSENEYKTYLLRSFKNSENTIIIMSDISSQQEIQQKQKIIENYSKKIIELEVANKDFYQLQEKAQNLAVRTGLINRISNSIRESLKLKDIIEITIKEISNTLGLDKGYFASFDPEKNGFILKNSWNIPENEINDLNLQSDEGIQQAFIKQKTVISSIMTNHNIKYIQPRIVTPVLYRDKILGILVFFHLNSKKTWHEEEISMIEGITAQLASAINQAELFKTILNQKNELEETLKKLKETQTQLIQSEKMASLGQLVAGVAHEINTPLGSVNSNNDILKKCLQKIKEEIKKPDMIEIFEKALSTNTEAVRRINELVRSLKNFARLDEAEYQEADIHQGLDSTIMLINHEIKNRIELVKEYGKLPPIKCCPNQLNQVFMNILVNSYQSIEGEGKITIKTKKEDNNIIISISDTGKGIKDAELSRIFDPGYTTKGVGVGTGLGLSISYQIIEKHKGKITVESYLNKGKTFKIELPAV